MKQIWVPFIFFVALLFSGCDQDSDANGSTTYETAHHAQLMGYMGHVRHVQVYCPEEDYLLLSADFDAAGRCLRWNDTGVESQPTIPVRGISSGWMASPASYEYFYNAQGQLVAVNQSMLGGETEHYQITYGNHDLFLPLPFPVGPLNNFPVQGISKIESEHYRLICDGKSATSERHTLAWMSLTEQTEYQFEQNKVAEKTMRLYGGRSGEQSQQLERVRTFYEYEGMLLKKVLEVAVDAEDYQEKLETIYSIEHPYMPEVKRIYTGMAPSPLYEMTYLYDVQGRVTNVQNTIGEPYFEMSYHQEYISFDDFGNWTSASRVLDGTAMSLQQQIGYW